MTYTCHRYISSKQWRTTCTCHTGTRNTITYACQRIRICVPWLCISHHTIRTKVPRVTHHTIRTEVPWVYTSYNKYRSAVTIHMIPSLQKCRENTYHTRTRQPFILPIIQGRRVPATYHTKIQGTRKDHARNTRPTIHGHHEHAYCATYRHPHK